jgi:kynurenine formamidase
MHTIIEYKGRNYECDLSKPLDISIPMQSGQDNPNAFHIQPPQFEPYRIGDFVGSVAQGGPVNCENLFINAHGNGTHTECVGHISNERITIHDSLKQFFFLAQLISVEPQNNEVNAAHVMSKLNGSVADAVIIRTLPNTEDKLIRKYSGNNPAWLEPDLCQQLRETGVQHLLVDLPSVDPEMDEGKLSAHHAFWNYPQLPRLQATITEMVFVPDHIEDGFYFINLQIASLQTDASPSKPVLYRLKLNS